MVRVAGVLPWLVLLPVAAAAATAAAATAATATAKSGATATLAPVPTDAARPPLHQDGGTTTQVTLDPARRNTLHLHASHPNVMVEVQEHSNDTLLGGSRLEQLREKTKYETHAGESDTYLYLGRKRFVSSPSAQSKRTEWILPLLSPRSEQADIAEQFPKSNIETAPDSYSPFQFATWNNEEKKISKRRRHKLRHGKRRWGRGYKMLLETDGSFDNIFRAMQVKDTLQQLNEQKSTLSGSKPYVSKSHPYEDTQHLQDNVTTEGAVVGKELGKSESTTSPNHLTMSQLYSGDPNNSKALSHNATTPESFPDLSRSNRQPGSQNGNCSILAFLTPTDKIKTSKESRLSGKKGARTYPQEVRNDSTLHEDDVIANKSRSEVLMRKVVRTLVSVVSLASLPGNPDLNLTHRSQDPKDLPMPNKRQTIKPVGEPRHTLLKNPLPGDDKGKHVAQSDGDISQSSSKSYSDSINLDSVKPSDLLQATKLSGDKENIDVKGSNSRISHAPTEGGMGWVRGIHNSPFLTLLSPGTPATGLEQHQSRAAAEHRFYSSGKRTEMREQITQDSDGDSIVLGDVVGRISAHSAMLHTASHPPPFQASKDQGTLKHNYLPSSINDAKAVSSSECYSTNDVVVAVFLTSVLNMVAFVFVTVALCWCSLRARATASAPRSLRSNDPNEGEVEENTEETAVPEGCLEACLPDISYQRHIARGSSLRPSFVMGRAFRPLGTPYSPRFSNAVHGLLHNLKATGGTDEKRNGVNGLLRRRSHSLENLSLT